MPDNPPTSPFARIEDAIAAYRRGEMIIVVDDEDRENEGDLTLAAEKVTPEAINFMARYGRGLICLALTGERLDALDLPLMVSHNTAHFGTAFTVSIEARGRTTTGISAADRAATVLAAIDPATQPRRPRAPRAHVPAARARRRRARARRADRGRRGPRADRRPHPGRRHLRDHERGRHDGARAGPRGVRAHARPAHDHDRRPHPLPDADRALRAARRDGRAADAVRRVPRRGLRERARRRDARRAGRAARSATGTTCWCACTPSA